MHTTAFGTIGVIITIVAGAVLLLALLVRAGRRLRERSRNPDPPADGRPPADTRPAEVRGADDVTDTSLRDDDWSDPTHYAGGQPVEPRMFTEADPMASMIVQDWDGPAARSGARWGATTYVGKPRRRRRRRAPGSRHRPPRRRAARAAPDRVGDGADGTPPSRSSRPSRRHRRRGRRPRPPNAATRA